MISTEMEKEGLQEFCYDRRVGKRFNLPANGFQVGFDIKADRPAHLIENSGRGARIVTKDKVKKDQTVAFKITTPERYLIGRARVAWKQTLESGAHIVGLQFLKTATMLR